jgi:hypothetical protein
VGKLMMRALRNDAQQTYSQVRAQRVHDPWFQCYFVASQGTHIFLYQTEQDVDDEKYFAMSLALLNDMLERAKRQELEHKASAGSRRTVAGTKRAVPGADDYFGDTASRNDPNLLAAKFPTTLEEFRKDISYFGVIMSTNDSLPSRDRLTSQRIVGRERICKLWQFASQGDGLGFIGKHVENTYPVQFDYMGNTVGDRTPGPFLQVRDCVRPGEHCEYNV